MGNAYSQDWKIGVISYVIMAVIIFIGIKSYRKANGGFLTIGQGLKTGIGIALIGAVLGEFLGGSQGLGYLIISSGAQFRVDRIFASIVILAMIGLSFLAIIQLIQNLFLKKYYF